MAPRYRVTLKFKERKDLVSLTRTAKTSGKLFRSARALLCDKGPEGPAWTVSKTAQALGVSSRMIEHLKRRFVQEGLEVARGRPHLRDSISWCESLPEINFVFGSVWSASRSGNNLPSSAGVGVDQEGVARC